MSKRADTHLRTLLIHGARALLQHAKMPGPWLQQLSQRRPPNVVIVALTNKMARTIWAVLAHDRAYAKDHVSLRPHASARGSYVKRNLTFERIARHQLRWVLTATTDRSDRDPPNLNGVWG